MHRDILTIDANATLRETSQEMSEKSVGALLVKEGDNYVGIISEEQLTRDGIAKGLDVETTPVRSIMRDKFIGIESNQSLGEARAVMKANRIRHLVVKEEGKIVGIITLSDLIRFYVEFFED